jgi:hypothetical protein
VKAPRFILGLLALLLVSCASDSNNSGRPESAPQGARIRTVDEWLADTSKDNGYKTDAKGNLIPRSNKRSSFENKGQSAYFKGQYEKKTYKAGEYSRTSFWGNKEYGRQQYPGSADGSRFQKNSRFGGQNAREAGNSAEISKAYQTGAYATSAAHEAGNTAIARPADAETEIRRKVYQPPEIIDWREQRQLTLEQSKGILGK